MNLLSKSKDIAMKYTPSFMWYSMARLYTKFAFFKYPKMIKSYYSNIECNDEQKDIIKYIFKHGCQEFPYDWADPAILKKVTKETKVYYDKLLDLPYVITNNNKRMYYPKEYKEIQIKYSFAYQQIEQHPNSPHRYLERSNMFNSSDIVVDCGGAEGNFSLEIIDYIKKIYIFEPEKKWIKPLHATFGPYKDKVVIVSKYVSDICDNYTITLDSYFSDKEKPTFIKMDVEGYEQRILSGAKRILTSDNLNEVIVCTYHKPNDDVEISHYLQMFGFKTSYSKGYMIFVLYDKEPPYLRRAIVKGKK